MNVISPLASRFSLRLSNISKTFGATIALQDVSFEVARGEVHALLGENGAGKSTLMKVVYGLEAPDQGEITIGDSALVARIASPLEARRHGVGMVHQHFTSIPALTVAENVALAAGWKETGRRLERRAAATIERLRLPLDATAAAGTLTAQLRQRLEIVQALATDARLLLLDEPTAVLAPREIDELLQMLRHFADAGGSVVLISHKLRELSSVADRVTVLRRGRVVLSGVSDTGDHARLAAAMIGEGEEIPAVARSAPVGTEPAITIGDVVLHRGELIGIAAIEGNGQRELLRAIAGVLPPRADVRVDGDVVFVPEERTTEALIGEFSLVENLLLGKLDVAPRWIDWSRLEVETSDLLHRYNVRAAGPTVAADSLSGGNQQRFVLGRTLERGAPILVAENPTRGLDVHATTEVHRRLLDAARNGACVVVHSSDLDEVLTLADRLLVLHDGAIRELPRDASRATVGDAMLGIS